jgi:hypothetical protein
VRWQISRQRTLPMCVVLSQAAMHSGMFLPVAPGGAEEPPDVSTGTVARALGSAVVAASRVAVGPVPTPIGVCVVVPGATSLPGWPGPVVVGAPGVVVVTPGVVGSGLPPLGGGLGSGGVARSWAPGLARLGDAPCGMPVDVVGNAGLPLGEIEPGAAAAGAV